MSRNAEYLKADFHALCRVDLPTFVAAALPALIGKTDHFAYLDLVSANIQNALVGGRLVINLPPRHLKSSVLTCTIAWYIGRNPTKEVMLVTYAQSLAKDLAGKLRVLMESSLYKELFPEGQVLAGRSGMSDFRTTKNGGLLAASFDAAITGRGAHAIFIDDAHAAHSIYTGGARQRVLDTFDTTLSTRTNDLDSSIILMAHRLHAEDLSDHLVAKNFAHLVLPYQAVTNEAYEMNGVSFTRREGELLQSGRVSLPTDLAVPEHVYQTQYQQMPEAMLAGILRERHFKPVDNPPEGGQWVFSWDLASTNRPDDHRSYTVALGFQVVRDVAYLRYILREQAEYTAIRRRAFDLHERFGPTHHLVEEASLGTSLISDLKNFGANPFGVSPGGRSKVDRLNEVLHMLERDYVRTVRDTGGLQDFINECLSFPNGRHDDQVDALTQFLKWANTKNSEQFRSVLSAGKSFAPNTRRSTLASIRKMVGQR